jgi:cytoskeletal protein RodZ
MTAGSELRQARERAGLSAEDISERTKIQLHRVEALERGDFSELPQGIYLDGIVRAYAHEVGIDPDPMVERVRVERGQLPGDWEVPFDAPIELYPKSSPDVRVLEPVAGDDNLDDFDAEEDLARAQTAAAAAAERAEARQSRRKYGLAIPLLAMIAAAGWGAYLGERHSVHRDETTEASEERDANTAATPPLPDRESQPEAGQSPAANETPSELSQDTSGPSYTSSPQARATSGTVDRPTAPPAWTRPETPGRNRRTANQPQPAAPQGEPAATQAQPPAPVPAERSEAPSSVPDVTGSWRLATQIESTSYAAYSGLRLGYEMRLEQEGARVTGTGRKVSENGNGIGRRAQTPVTVSGTIEGDRLTLNFVEQGTRRATQGKFVLLVDDERTLRGRFSSDAARSSGRVEAHRVASQ